jgi:hypothetical protein
MALIGGPPELPRAGTCEDAVSDHTIGASQRRALRVHRALVPRSSGVTAQAAKRCGPRSVAIARRRWVADQPARSRSGGVGGGIASPATRCSLACAREMEDVEWRPLGRRGADRSRASSAITPGRSARAARDADERESGGRLNAAHSEGSRARRRRNRRPESAKQKPSPFPHLSPDRHLERLAELSAGQGAGV